MARRQRSYFAKSNKGKAGEVFLNNVLAGSSANAKKKAKAKASSSAKAASAAKAAAKARERTAKAAAKERERTAKAAAKERERLIKKREPYEKRLKLEFEKLGLYPVSTIVSDITTQAIEAGVTPAKTYSYFIEGKEAELSMRIANDWIVSECSEYSINLHMRISELGWEHYDFLENKDQDIFFRMKDNILDAYSEQGTLIKVITDCRPQSDAINHPLFQNLINAYKNFEDIVEDLLDIDWSIAKMFSYDVVPFLRLCIDNKWTLDEATCSEEYVNLTSKKMLYYEDLVRQSKWDE